MQKNTLYIVIGIILLLLVGGGAFFLMNKNSSPEIATQTQPGQIETQTGSSVQSTLKDLLAGGKAQKCIFSDKMENTDISGTMYLAGKRMRGDFNSVVEGKTMGSHMIFENNTAYNWSDGQTTGMMFKMDPNEVQKTQSDGAPNQQFDPNKVVDYKCSGWSADNSMFTPPSNVKFNDLSALTAPSGALLSPGGQGNFNMCATCDNLAGDKKLECRTALKCS